MVTWLKLTANNPRIHDTIESAGSYYALASRVPHAFALVNNLARSR